MQTFEQLVRKAFAAAEARQRTRLPKAKEIEREQIRKEIEFLGRTLPGVLELLPFCQSCKLKIGRPKVMRTRGNRSGHTFEHRDRFVKLDLTLSGSGKSFHIMEPGDVESFWVITEYDSKDEGTEVRKQCLPQVCSELNGVYNHNYEADVRQYLPGIVAAFDREVGDSWHGIVRAVRDHVKEVEANLDRIIDEFVAKRGGAERTAFQVKFSDCLKGTRGLIDAPPEAILAVFRLGWKEIDTLRAFAKRNKADTTVVELDDVVESQNLARAKSVMEA